MISDIITALHDDFTVRCHYHSDIVDHLQFMRDTVIRYQDAVVIEMGVRSGNSTSALLSGAVLVNGSLWSVDISPPQVPPDWHSIPAWHFMQGDSVSGEVLAWMPEKADVVFMDTSHTFDQQLAELRAYMPRIRPGGIVMIHDTQCLPGDDFATDYFIPQAEPTGPVSDAIDAYCEESGLTWYNRHSEPGLYGMGVIIIPGGDDE